MQQEANKKLNFTARKTMRIAQGLYEGVTLGRSGSIGLITYMRTDSTRVSDQAKEQARNYINEHYGANYYSGHAGAGKKSGSQNVQDAHEAIRPDVYRQGSREHQTVSFKRRVQALQAHLVALHRQPDGCSRNST